MKLFAGVEGGIIEYQPNFESTTRGNAITLTVSGPVTIRPRNEGQSYIVLRYAPGSLLIVSESHLIVFLDERTGEMIHEYDNDCNVWAGAIYKNWFVFGGDKGELKIMNLNYNFKLEYQKKVTGSIYGISVTSTGLFAICSSQHIVLMQFQHNQNDGNVSLLEVAKINIQTGFYAIDISANEQKAIAAGSSILLVIDLNSHAILHQVKNKSLKNYVQEEQTFNCVRFLNNTVAALTSWGGTLVLYDIEKQEVIQTIQAHGAVIMGLATFNQEWVVTAGYDGKLNIWHYEPVSNTIVQAYSNGAEKCNIACVYLDVLAESLLVSQFKRKLVSIQKRHAFADLKIQTG